MERAKGALRWVMTLVTAEVLFRPKRELQVHYVPTTSGRVVQSPLFLLTQAADRCQQPTARG